MPERVEGGPAAWGTGPARRPWSIGVEDEALLVDPLGGLCNRVEDVFAAMGRRLADSASAETHACVVELRTAPHATVPSLAAELAGLRAELEDLVGRLGLGLAAAGTHPLAHDDAGRVTEAPRYREIARMMRALARRVPTLALHVHVGVPDPEAAVRALDGLRGDLPLLLALSANSPFAAGRVTGFASYRTPVFSAFPRVGIPRAFGSYPAYAGVVDALVDGGAIPDESFLWWDVRLRPRHGTVEVRIMDAPSRVEDLCALAALVQCLVRRYAEDPPGRAAPPEVLAENRFVAARDGVRADLLGASGRRCSVPRTARELVERCRDVAVDLGSAAELEHVMALAADPGYARQRRVARRHGITAVVPSLAEQFTARCQSAAAA